MIIHSDSMLRQAPSRRFLRRWQFGVLITLMSLLPLGVAVPPLARALTLNVNSPADAVDMNIGDGTCATDAKGTCTLRAAIQEVNATSDQANTITLPPGTYTLTLTGAGEDAAATGDLDILNNLEIMSAGTGQVIINGNGDRVFDIFAPATVMLSGVIIQNGNAQNGNGGGIRNAGTLALTSVAITGNTASEGGGLANVGSGSAQLTNVTISGNSASLNGGGIANIEKNTTVSLLNVTVSANSAVSQGQGIENLGGGNLENTIVANGNKGAGNCSGKGLTSLGHNIDNSPSSICLASPTASDLNVDPLLGPLRDNGGFTLTQALLPGSPAIDAGDNMSCPATDQRGQPRPADGDSNGSAICDIGAYEVQGPATPTPTPSGTGVSTATPTPTATPITPTATPGGPSIDLSTATGMPGDQVMFTATLRTGGAEIVDAENDTTFDALNTPIGLINGAPDCNTNPDIEKLSLFQFFPRGCTGAACTTVRAFIFPLIPPPPAPTPIPAIADGSTLYTCRVNISASATPGEYPLAVSMVLMDNSLGTPVPDAIGRNGKIVVLVPPTATSTPSATSTATATETDTPTMTSTPMSTATVTPTVTPTHAACIGDCNDNRVVTIDEVVTLADLTLDPVGAKPCPANRSDPVTVDQTIAAAGNLLNGCPP